MIPRPAWAVPARGQKFAADIMAAERQNGLPFNLLARLLYQESRFRDDIINGEVISPAGAVGIAQIIPRWHPNVDPTNPQASIFYAAGYLRENADKFGTWEKALASYNWGPSNVSRAVNILDDKWLMGAPSETQKYVREIIADVPEAQEA